MAKQTKQHMGSNDTAFSSLVQRFQNYESEISSFLGVAVVVMIIGVLLFLLRGALPKSQISETGTTTEQEELTSATPNSYTVKAGQGLWQIAEEVYDDGSQWTVIAEANKLVPPYTLTTGQSLSIPLLSDTVAQATPSTLAKTSSSPTTVNTSTTTASVVSEGEYLVVAGDSLWKIALSQYKDGLQWTKIYELNKALIGKNPGLIHPGQKLVLAKI